MLFCPYMLFMLLYSPYAFTLFCKSTTMFNDARDGPTPGSYIISCGPDLSLTTLPSRQLPRATPITNGNYQQQQNQQQQQQQSTQQGLSSMFGSSLIQNNANSLGASLMNPQSTFNQSAIGFNRSEMMPPRESARSSARLTKFAHALRTKSHTRTNGAHLQEMVARFPSMHHVALLLRLGPTRARPIRTNARRCRRAQLGRSPAQQALRRRSARSRKRISSARIEVGDAGQRCAPAAGPPARDEQFARRHDGET